jgi:hypothetical protein
MRSQAVDEGHCGLPTGELVPLTAELLETQQELVETALNLEVSDGTSRTRLHERSFVTFSTDSGSQSAPNAAVTARRIGSCAVFGGRNMRLWQIATANRLSGSAQAIEPPAPGWPMALGLWPI